MASQWLGSTKQMLKPPVPLAPLGYMTGGPEVPHILRLPPTCKRKAEMTVCVTERGPVTGAGGQAVG